MSRILSIIEEGRFTPFADLFKPEEGKAGVVVTFLAILELVKEKLVEIVQAQPFSDIHVRINTQETQEAFSQDANSQGVAGL